MRYVVGCITESSGHFSSWKEPLIRFILTCLNSLFCTATLFAAKCDIRRWCPTTLEFGRSSFVRRNISTAMNRTTWTHCLATVIFRHKNLWISSYGLC
ncbi:hypothetical protein CEXT_118501 [Caerostris extrusa]|uniref:Uncharacterized protein n=1 Tax=Caerostris extrusa TaxID=172846 RepID=A0AAV4Y8W7_CAEEX|nr:hypothetical protein CEXT_118501 [Caerostris extrusa]